MPDDIAPVYPIGLVLEGKPCLVVGGGKVAARKIRGLLLCRAAVTVVAPEVHEAVTLLAGEGAIESIEGAPLKVELRPYRSGEAARYSLVFCATNDPEVDEQVHRDALAAGVWVNSADDLAHCSFVLPAVFRDGPVTVAVSSSGESPALSRWLRDRIAEEMGAGMAELARLLAEARRELKSRGESTDAIDWSHLLGGPLPSLVASGRIDEARALLESELGRTSGEGPEPGEGD